MRFFRTTGQSERAGIGPADTEALTLLKPYLEPPAIALSPEVLPQLRTCISAQADLQGAERRVVFFGAFKSGKSTLINALLGAPLLPARANRATAVPVTIRYGAKPTATLLRESDAVEYREEQIPVDDIARHILLDVAGPTAVAPAGIRELVLRLPLPLLRGGCVLVDTPGLLDNDELSQRSFCVLQGADLAVMVLAADRLLSEREKKVARQVAELLGGNLVFVVNRLGAVESDERETVLAWAGDGLAGLGNELVGNPRVFATDAKAALEARGRSAKNAAGVRALERWLRETLGGSAGGRIALRSRLSLLDRQIGALHEWCLAGQVEAAEHLAAARQEAARHAAERATRRQQQRAEARAGLARLRDALDRISQEFVEDCVTRAEMLAASGTLAPGQLNLALRLAAKSFTQRVRRDTQAAIGDLEIVAGSFVLEVDGQFSSTQTLVGLGRWFVKSGLGGDPRSAVRDEMRRAAGPVSQLLRAEALLYLAEVEQGLAHLASTEEPERESEAESAAIQDAVRTEAAWSGLASWCEDWRLTVATAKAELLC